MQPITNSLLLEVLSKHVSNDFRNESTIKVSCNRASPVKLLLVDNPSGDCIVLNAIDMAVDVHWSAPELSQMS